MPLIRPLLAMGLGASCLLATELAHEDVTVATTARLDLEVQIDESMSALPVFSYYAPDDAGSPWGQDHSGSADLTESGNSLVLSGNAWKTVEVDYAVTADTVIDLTFDSAVASQAQGIALMTAEGATEIPLIQLGGYEVWPTGSQTYNTHVPGSGSITYSIPVGNLIDADTYQYLVFVNDDDEAVGSDAALSWVWLRDEISEDLLTQAQATNPANVRVQWQDVSNVEWYMLARKRTTVTNQVMVNLLPSDGTNVVDAQLGTGPVTDLRYDVRALQAGPVELAADLDVTPLDLGLQQTRNSDTEILVEWTAQPEADYFLLDRKQQNVPDQVMIIFLPQDSVEYLDTSVVAAANYVYNIFAGLPDMLGNV